jgi:hypothetical protein
MTDGNISVFGAFASEDDLQKAVEQLKLAGFRNMEQDAKRLSMRCGDAASADQARRILASNGAHEVSGEKELARPVSRRTPSDVERIPESRL